MSLDRGAHLGPYEILAPLGAGGMGEVYKARDPRLDRVVAIKILPREFASNARLRLRLEREAKSISSLNDSHICALHDVGTDNGIDYLVMELCEGPNLAQLLGRGPLPVPQTIEYGMQIASALEHAHRRGIIHRDLKPANVAVTRGGLKVLDFGLAKQDSAASAEGAEEAATLAKPLTEEGQICGTVQYMAPEVLKGAPADARSDVFALGLILYEMITGRAAFTGSNKASLIAAILEREPPKLTDVTPGTPAPLARLVTACLAKDPEQRIDSAHDVRLQLEWLARGDDAPTVERRPRIRIIVAAVAALSIVCALAGFLLATRLREDAGIDAQPKGTTTRMVADLRGAAPLALGQITPRIGFSSPVLALSHDGSTIVYVGFKEGRTSLFTRRLDSWEIREIAGTEGAHFAFFSPDDAWIGFLTDDKVMKIPFAGGSAIALADASSPDRAVWLGDGSIYVADYEGSRLKTISPTGEVAEFSSAPGTPVKFEDVLPDGRAALVSGRAKTNADFNQIAVFDLESRTIRPILTGGYDARFVPPRTLMFVRGGDLHAVEFDPARREVKGAPSIIQSGVATHSFFLEGQYAVSGRMLAYVPGGNRAIGRLAWVDRAGATTFLDLPPRAYGVFDIAPDGKRIAIQVSDVADSLLIAEPGKGREQRVPLAGDILAPRWMPDGRAIIVGLVPGKGDGTLVRVRPDMSGNPETIYSSGRAFVQPMSISRDGRRIAFQSMGSVGILTIGDPSSVEWISRDGHSFCGELSPDGRWIAVTSWRTGSYEIWLHDVQSPERAYQISSGGGTETVWCLETNELFYRNGRRWYAAKIISSGGEPSWEPPRLVWETDFIDTPGISFDVSADGQRLLVSKQVAEEIRDRIHVVQNWASEVAKQSSRR